jgi:tetratricopeptide (TPR) repeat protein
MRYFGGYAAAYAELAMSEYFAADWTNDDDGRKRALVDADKSVALAPDQADGYAARGHIRAQGPWDWAGARADFEKALAIDPSHSIALRRTTQFTGPWKSNPNRCTGSVTFCSCN